MLVQFSRRTFAAPAHHTFSAMVPHHGHTCMQACYCFLPLVVKFKLPLHALFFRQSNQCIDAGLRACEKGRSSVSLGSLENTCQDACACGQRQRLKETYLWVHLLLHAESIDFLILVSAGCEQFACFDVIFCGLICAPAHACSWNRARHAGAPTRVVCNA